MDTKSEILKWPNPALKLVCLPVDPADPSLPDLIDTMKRVMAEKRGVGLAANQLGYGVRVLVLDAGDGPEVFLNPRIVKLTGAKRLQREGCLSVPGWAESVARHDSVIVEHQTPYIPTYVEPWEPSHLVAQEYTGVRAHILQHECDHLDGKFFLDYRKGAADQVRALIRKGVLK